MTTGHLRAAFILALAVLVAACQQHSPVKPSSSQAAGNALTTFVWHEAVGVHNPVPDITEVVDALRPGYRSAYNAIMSDPAQPQQANALEALRQRYIGRAREIRRASYVAYYFRDETRKTCHDYSGRCDATICKSAPNRDLYTTAEWAAYFRGHNISDNSMDGGWNGELHPGNQVPILDDGARACSVDAGTHNGTIKIWTRFDFHYRPAAVDRMTVEDGDRIFARL